MVAPAFYPARAVKWYRATRAEMEERAEFLIDYADEHGPVIRPPTLLSGRCPRAAQHRKRRQRLRQDPKQVLRLRREGRLNYGKIADATNWMRKPTAFDGPEEAIQHWSRAYRKDLWADADDYAEVWCEKDALAGVIYPVTAKYDVPLMVARGFASETFCYEAIAQRSEDTRPYHVYYLGDFDRAWTRCGPLP